MDNIEEDPIEKIRQIPKNNPINQAAKAFLLIGKSPLITSFPLILIFFISKLILGTCFNFSKSKSFNAKSPLAKISSSLLCIIPGIVKGYEYRMIPYLLADHPEMTKDEAFAASKEMMMGQKWNAFVLDLSFIGWDILSSMTFGILDIFYVMPYKMSTNAALYEAIKYGTAA